MELFHQLPSHTSYTLFYILHPLHVLLSALVTSSIFKIHQYRSIRGVYMLPALFIIGYTGSIGIATVSDSIIPFLGEILLDLPKREVHIGFIEKWWLVNPLAFLGIAISYFRPTTKFPHTGHVLLSTWASLFHMIMALGGGLNILSYIGIFMFLFLAVWIPCCVSDIVFPLLFVKARTET
jgi:ABC-type transport system involved in cytochrome c biogenesis permease subunit